MNLRLVATVLAATMAAGVLAPDRCLSAQAPPQDSTPPVAAPATAPTTWDIARDIAEYIRRDRQQLAAILNDPNSTREQRDEAARRLLARRTPEARAVLGDALMNLANPDAQAAAARALADDPDPDPALIDPLFAALWAGNRSLSEAAARALANYRDHPEVLTRLMALVQRRPPAQDLVRREAILVLGSFVEKRTAELLMNLLRAADESEPIRRAAAEALADLAAQSRFGQDLDQWNQWWATQANRPEGEFRAEMLARRSARLEQFRRRYGDLSVELKRLLTEQYTTAANASQRAEMLLRFMRSAEAEIRAIGAAIVREEVLDNRPVSAAAREQVRLLIGDSSPKVREQAAATLAAMNDAEALGPLLAQLAIETEPAVRARLADALAPINDLRAVPALLAMLNDPSPLSATAAARALEQLGPKIRDSDAALARQTAEALRQAFERLRPGTGTAELREAVIDAMAPLRQESLLPTLMRLLEVSRGESSQIRGLALRAIGELGDPRSASVVADYLGDRDPRVRYRAVEALGKLRNADRYWEQLRQRLDPDNEPDPSVQKSAWLVLQSLLPQLAIEELANLAERFRAQPERQMVVLTQLAEKLSAQGRLEQLAGVHQNLGAIYMRLNDPRRAAEYFRLALEYWASRPQRAEVVVTNLINDRMRALLLDRQYTQAIDFASENIRQNINHQPAMGALIRQEAERLTTSFAYDDALKLIAAARTMDPPLGPVALDQLTRIETEIRNRLGEAAPATTRAAGR
ncbi:HEAT repeat domain-containing protein [Fontivita pretiosa]|uniref:HEAT repeat domain-containing protein n=1 Tax=Fontivita pretiosa TaxID=2989684 RepID=UPI003D1788D8